MRRVCFLFLGIVCVSFGMDRDFRIDRSSSGVVCIRECEAKETKKFRLNDNCDFRGIIFHNFCDGVSLKPSNTNDQFGLIKINSEIPLAIENVTASDCIIFSPELLIVGQCKIGKLIASKNVSVEEKGNLVAKQIDFPQSSANLCVFDVFGKLEGSDLELQGDRVTITNKGAILLGNLCLSNFGKESSIDFLQKGSLTADRVEQHGRLFQNFGQTQVKEYNCVTPTKLEIEDGNFFAGLLYGNIHSLLLHLQGKAHFDKIRGHLGYFRNRSAFLEVGETDLDTKINLNSRENAVTRMEQFNTPIGRIVTSNATTQVYNANIGNASTRGVSAVDIRKSKIDSVYVNDQSKLTLDSSLVKRLENENVLVSKYSNVGHLINSGKAYFGEQNGIDVAENKGYLGNVGTAYINCYEGEQNSALETMGVSEQKVLAERNSNYSIVHLAPGAATYIKSAEGEGKMIAPVQKYFGHMLKGFELHGNVDVFLDYMPKDTEISKHVGDFKVHVNLRDDFVNESDRQYGDVIFFIDMNGHDWKNIESNISAGGLSVRNAEIFGNYDGRISLQDFLSVQAERILNIATPMEKENGRWVRGQNKMKWIGRSPSVHFYMPAPYYLRNRNEGISAGEGGISMKAKDSVTNEFSNVFTTGELQVNSGGTFRNTVSNIYAGLKSWIQSKYIYNDDVGAISRQGEFHDKGQNREKTWHYDLYVAELVNQSEGSKMIFGNGVGIKGDELHVIGSKILGSDINIDCRIQDFRSVIDNIAEVGGKIYSNGQKFTGIAMQMWSVKNEKDL